MNQDITGYYINISGYNPAEPWYQSENFKLYASTKGEPIKFIEHRGGEASNGGDELSV